MSEERITDPKTGGQKGRKPERFDLLPFDALEEVARVYGIGARKYDADNWTKGYAWRLSAGALLRHVARFMCGEDRDPETGCLHLAHAAWHCLTLLAFHMRGLGTDDRCVPPEPRDEAWHLDELDGEEGPYGADGPIPYIPTIDAPDWSVTEPSTGPEIITMDEVRARSKFTVDNEGWIVAVEDDEKSGAV